MASYNKVLLMGNLTRDPELKFTPKGTAVVDIAIAVNEKWKDANGVEKEEVLFVDVTYFGKTAEVIEKHFKKGQPIFIEGKLKLDQWEDKQTGQQRSRLKVNGDTFQFVGNKSEGGQRQESHQPARRTEAPPARRQEQQEELPVGGGADDDDIPF